MNIFPAAESVEEVIKDIVPEELTPGFFEKLLDKFLNYIPVIISALILWIIGSIVNKVAVKLTSAALSKSRFDKTIHGFVISAVRILIQIFTFIIVLSVLGIPMTSIIAALSAAGLAIGLALQSSLSNVAGGFIVLFSKPFRSGDYISAAGVEGVVQEISIINTKILTVDNKSVFVPNGTLAASTITNYTNEKLRRVDLCFGISYKDDFNKAKAVISSVMAAHSKVLDTPASLVRVSELAASSVNITARAWVKSEDYWDVYFDLIEQVKTAFDENDISVPFDQLDVHIEK